MARQIYCEPSPANGKDAFIVYRNGEPIRLGVIHDGSFSCFTIARSITLSEMKEIVEKMELIEVTRG